MKYSLELAKDYSQKREQFNETDKVLVDALESIGVQDKKILDLGCGDGRHARLIKEMGAAHVIGIDVNEKMIEIAKDKSAENPDVTFFVADGRNLPAEDNSTDIVVSNFVVHYFPDAKEIFNEISRVLKDKSYFIGTFNITDVEEGFEYLYNQQMPIRLGQGEGSIIVQNLIKSRQEIEAAIAEAGFIVTQEQELDHPNAIVDDSFSDKLHIQKHATMLVLQKNIKK
ncbi:MAG: class I SAM-dependent methyltransferase [bacterium]